VKAYQLTAWQHPPELREVPEPEPRPGEVLLKVAGAGACHSDLHLMEFPPGQLPFDPPFTLGHENTGWVAALGAGVTGFEEGDAVAVYGPWGCGRCRQCRQGRENYCDRAREIGVMGGGLGRDGGMAEYQLVPSARLLVPLPDGFAPVAAAPLGDAALTPYHAIKRSLHLLEPGSSTVVIGVGGLGHMAVQILRALTPTRIIAVDTAEEKLTLAKEVGADDVVLAADDAAAQVASITGGRGAELVLDIVGSDETLASAAQMTRMQGELTVIGIAMGTFPFNFFALPYECSLATTYWGSAVELMEVLELAAAGKIHAHVERYPLDRVAEVYDLLRAGKIDGRAVVVPSE
jgi:propanol-preferring alcohol dehydrogenase